MSSQATVIHNGRIVRSDRIVDGHLLVKDGVISYMGPEPPRVDRQKEIDASGCYILPGFVDLHVHGGCGFDITSGLFNPETGTFDEDDRNYREMLPRVAAHLARHGVTFAPLATIAAPEERLERALGLLADYVQDDRNGTDGCYIGGAFIEGTFIKEPSYAGAQNPANFREPSLELFERLDAAARGTIRYVSVAPEYGSKATTLIRELKQRGVLVGAGHTAATAEEYMDAVDSGLRVAVHLTNGPTASSFKPFGGGGALQAALSSRKVFAELIMDGYHISAGYVCDIIRRKGPYRVCLITDGMFVTGAEGITEFQVGGIRGVVSPGGDYLSVVGKDNTLFGSVLTMDAGFCNVVNWQMGGHPGIWTQEHPSLDKEGAILAASRYASTNPARALQLFEPESTPFGRSLEGCFGSLMVGKRADIVVMGLGGERGSYKPDIRHVFTGGRKVFTADGEKA